ncbi:DeoR/GlpR family DNA-binding transcription regulator [Companilactobacillus sp. DQM5]|uniref:DeoR/GlpR family DNA-binding transcription regulator n=1 Tax=Companilactobacillus sp. DQM5 TaxID=3463359 RepID=UPI00405871C5
MLKNERLLKIVKLVDESNIITVNTLVKKLGVSTMTIRRDLEELSKNGQIIRIHGGAESAKSKLSKKELTYVQKKSINVFEKKEVAQLVASMINEDETVYIGPGTTNEFIAMYCKQKNIRVVTNSLPVFNSFRELHDYEICLVGGVLRERSGAFIGGITLDSLKHLRTSKAFVSVNGINEDSLMNASPEEGNTQRIALQNADRKFVVADHSKFNHSDFFSFWNLKDVDAVITDSALDVEVKKEYENEVAIIQP